MESFIFIFKAGCFSTVTYNFGHFDQLLSKAFNRGRTFDWCSCPELNWDKQFRKQKRIIANASKSGRAIAKSDTSFDTVFFNW
jgi:hypothetical protein